MEKAVFLGGFVSAGFLIVGTYVFPTSLLMWFASTSGFYVVARALLMVLLLGVLLSAPPRKVWMRMVMGIVALGLAGWGIGLAMTDSMHILDMIVFLEAGIAMGIEALEFTEEELLARAAQLHTPQSAANPVRSFSLRPIFALLVRTVRQLRTVDRTAWLEFRLPTSEVSKYSS